MLQKKIREGSLKLIAQNPASVKAHNKKLRIDTIFFRMDSFLAIKDNMLSSA